MKVTFEDFVTMIITYVSLLSVTGHGPFSHLYDNFLKRAFEEHPLEERDRDLLQVMFLQMPCASFSCHVLHFHKCHVLHFLMRFAQHENRSVKLLEKLMDDKGLWNTFDLKETDDRKFLKALITFDKMCASDREEKQLLQV